MTATQSSPQRRLAAILHADIVDYSGQMAADESGVHAELAACMALASEAVLARGGRIVGTAGDAFLAEFPSASDAVAAALGFQSAMAERTARLREGPPLAFRIGINLGDVIVDGTDIFGDGVNVAARLQALAEPGGITASAPVRDLLRTKPEIAFDDLGSRRVRHLPEPIRVYAVRERRSGRRVRKFARPAIVLAAAGIVVLAIGASIPLLPELRQMLSGMVGEVQRGAEPTVAVLPFEDRAGAEGYFSAGVTEDLIAALGRFSGLEVLSWSAVAPYRDRSVDPARLGEQLDVRYVVSGSVRRSRDRLRVAVQLAEARTGTLLWSEVYEEPLADVFVVQDRISRAVADALSVELSQLESRRAFEKPTADLAAYDRVLRGRALMRRATHDANLDARALFEAALAADPDYAEAHIGAGWTHMNDMLWGWSEWPGEALARAREHASAALEHDPRNARAHALLAGALRFQMELGHAAEEAARAIELNPSDPTGHAVRGGLLLWSGQLDRAVEALETAVRLDPNPPNLVAGELAKAYFLLDRYEDTLGALDRIAQQMVEDPNPHAMRAASLAALGRMDEAARAAARVKRLSPFFDPRAFASNFRDPDQARRLLEGMRKAGL